MYLQYQGYQLQHNFGGDDVGIQQAHGGVQVHVGLHLLHKVTAKVSIQSSIDSQFPNEAEPKRLKIKIPAYVFSVFG